MPQITNLNIGPAVTVSNTDPVLFRAVPSQSATTKAWEHSVDGAPELGTKITAGTSRRASRAQTSMVRSHRPVIRSIDDVNTAIGASVIVSNFTFPPQATEVEKLEALDLHIKALKNQFFIDVLIHGESMN